MYEIYNVRITYSKRFEFVAFQFDFNLNLILFDENVHENFWIQDGNCKIHFSFFQLRIVYLCSMIYGIPRDLLFL